MIIANQITFSISSKLIIDNVSVTIPAEQITCITGKNGSGKSTLFKVIAGYWLPQSGYVQVEDFIIDKNTRHDFLENCGVLIDTPRFYPFLTTAENLTVRSKELGIKTPDIDVVLETFNLQEYKEVKGAKLSSGNKLKLGLATCMLNDPAYLLLDEPTSTLDPDATHYLGELIKQINRDRKTTVCVVSHDPTFVNQIADRKYVFNESNRQFELSGGNIKAVRLSSADLSEVILELYENKLPFCFRNSGSIELNYSDFLKSSVSRFNLNVTEIYE